MAKENTVAMCSDAARPTPRSQADSAPHECAVDWHALVKGIQTNDPAGGELLYTTFRRGIRYFLARKLGTDCEDGVNETLLMVFKAIRNGEVREPERLPGFVRTVAMRYAFGVIGQRVHSREKEVAIETSPYTPVALHDPERDAMVQQRAELIRKTLRKLSARDREILVRFYLQEQSPEQICEEMRMTDTQFRLYKSRAKAKFGELGKKELQRRPPAPAVTRNGHASPATRAAQSALA